MGEIFNSLSKAMSESSQGGTEYPELDTPVGFEGTGRGSMPEGVYRYDPDKDQMYKEIQQKQDIKKMSKALGAYKDSSKVKPVKNTQKLSKGQNPAGQRGFARVSDADYKGSTELKTAKELTEMVLALAELNAKSRVLGKGIL
jgi:hypothetical protein